MLPGKAVPGVIILPAVDATGNRLPEMDLHICIGERSHLRDHLAAMPEPIGWTGLDDRLGVGYSLQVTVFGQIRKGMADKESLQLVCVLEVDDHDDSLALTRLRQHPWLPVVLAKFAAIYVEQIADRALRACQP
jgi:hypothetical protein